MKIFCDVVATLGSDFIFLNAFDWVDFENRTKVLGSRISVLSLKNYEKVIVKVPVKRSALANLERGQAIAFDGLEATVWVNNGFPSLSCQARSVRA